jgi:hypothetical protein
VEAAVHALFYKERTRNLGPKETIPTSEWFKVEFKELLEAINMISLALDYMFLEKKE